MSNNNALAQLHRHIDKTVAALHKIHARFGPHAQHDSRDPVELSLDELREGLLAVERAEQLILDMCKLLQKPPPAEIDPDQTTLHLLLWSTS